MPSGNFEFVFQDLDIYRVPLDNMLNNPTGEVGKYLRRRGLAVLAAAQAQVGVDTGELKRSLKMTHLRDSRGQYLWIGSHLGYALAHHNGTKPHVIVPREAPILRFSTGTRIVYTRHVNHPGTRPNRYLSDNMRLVHAF